jgi:hypothetical protein
MRLLDLIIESTSLTLSQPFTMPLLLAALAVH